MDKDNWPVMVSIRCATYNQAPYIRQCLDGFVMQKTNFRFEAIVHDDASTDGTTDIVREYAEKYPDIIKPMYEKENQYSKNLAAMNNAINKRLIGKYVAICEGDDYWSDSLKLQKQFNYMEAHPECSLCFHPNYRLFSSGRILLNAPRRRKSIFGIPDIILGGGGFMATNSMFFHRHNYLSESDRPEWYKTSKLGDVPLRLYLSSKGSVGYIDEPMSVYRKGQGAWTRETTSVVKRVKVAKEQQRTLRGFDEYTKYKYHWYVILGIILNWMRCLKLIICHYVKK